MALESFQHREMRVDRLEYFLKIRIRLILRRDGRRITLWIHLAFIGISLLLLRFQSLLDILLLFFLSHLVLLNLSQIIFQVLHLGKQSVLFQLHKHLLFHSCLIVGREHLELLLVLLVSLF